MHIASQKTLHLNGTYSWYTFAENILNTNEITEQNIEATDFNKEKWHLTKSLKKTLLENYENMFFEKLRSFNINNKLFLYSKIKTNYFIEPFIENSNFKNRKLIMEMRISDHVLEIERGRYNKINREHRQCHLNVIEDEEHFFFHCQKSELLRKEFLTQIENLYTKFMGNNHIQNLDFFLSSSCRMQLAAPFIQKL